MLTEEKNMTETEQSPTENDAGHNEKRRSARTPRAIRFSDPEWERVETAAKRRGITPAQFVRDAVLAATESQVGSFPPEITAQIESIEAFSRRSNGIKYSVKDAGKNLNESRR